MKGLNIIPAIDLIDGKCVRLTQGDYDRSKVYSEDPLEVAKKFESAGATRLHLVDLDGAKASHPSNLGILRKIVQGTGLTVEFGGGIKSEESLRMVLEDGASFAICGSIAVSAPDLFRSWLESFGDEIILGLDLKNGRVATHGWKQTSQVSGSFLLKSYEGLVKQAIVTEISRDGMLQGVDAAFYASLQREFPDVEIIVSGGVSSLEDLECLRSSGLKAAVVGKAIYEGRVQVSDLFN